VRRFASFTALAVVGLCVVTAAGAAASIGTPEAPALGRFGVVPHRGTTASSEVPSQQLTYHGGRVTVGAPRVYLVYWGKQWGAASVGSDGYKHLAGDPAGVAPYQQAFFAGLGTNGELWDGVTTQYCSGVATGATSCPTSSTKHVGYPTGGALAGVWYDSASAEPQAATQAQIAAEAVRAAKHFGNNTQQKNGNVQYVVTSAHGTNPDRYKIWGFCAWHSYTTTTVAGTTVKVAYTNMPYVPDVGGTCGANFVNDGAAGSLDGISIVNGHEYSETITDQFPNSGWIDAVGEENADKCAWISSGQGAAANLALATGTFAVQSTWSNDLNGGVGGCEVSHPIVPNS